MYLYGEKLECEDCGSDNTVEKTRTMNLPTLGETDYPALVCQTCGWERSL
jgi:C4-type Zn-finger protein